MIHSSSDGAVTTIELDREVKRNALDEEMLDGLSAAFTAAVDSGARAIVLTGRGAVFSAGADLSGPVYDLDFIDPVVAPGVGTPVVGGPTYREAQLCMEMIADTGQLGSIDIVELNPALDQRNATAELAVDLLESLFGKSTLVRMQR